MEYTITEPGYRITVESYENDVDYIATESISGLNKEQAAFAIDILRLFGGKFGNLYSITRSERRELADAVYDIMQKHPISHTYIDMLDRDDEDYTDEMSGQAMDFVSNYGLTAGEQFSRYVNYIKVEHIPVEIKILDVTEEFN